jgi:hypothetical protein
MDFLHAVWLGRNEKDCDEVYPECSDIYSGMRFKGGTNSTLADTDLEGDLHMDELLNDLRYLEENATQHQDAQQQTHAEGEANENHTK